MVGLTKAEATMRYRCPKCRSVFEFAEPPRDIPCPKCAAESSAPQAAPNWDWKKWARRHATLLVTGGLILAIVVAATIGEMRKAAVYQAISNGAYSDFWESEKTQRLRAHLYDHIHQVRLAECLRQVSAGTKAEYDAEKMTKEGRFAVANEFKGKDIDALFDIARFEYGYTGPR